MNRHTVALLCVGAILLATGCVGSSSPEETDSPPSIHAENLTLERGERGNLTIRATNVSDMRFLGSRVTHHGRLVYDLGVSLESDDVSFEPGGVLQADSAPPIWQWDEVERAVTVNVPVRAGENATIGRYSLEIAATQDADFEPEPRVADDATVRVVNRSHDS